jgi:hypothetical protein
MLGNRKLVIDTGCGMLNELDALANDKFSIFQEHTPIPGAIYLIGYEQTQKNIDKIIELANTDIIKVIFTEPVEGSSTAINRCRHLGILDLIKEGKVLLLTGGDVPAQYPHLVYETFLPKILDYDENINAIQTYNNNYSTNRPYKFLFLNGQERYHRKFMIAQLSDILDTAVWSNLDSGNGTIKLLDKKYEYDQFKVNFPIVDKNVKAKLFGTGIWGDIILAPSQYNDTYFSLVTETVFDCPYSFRTEKIWKPVAIGHPWIAVANQGFYRDMHNLGFQTFGNAIDESFDNIENNHDRMMQVSRVVKDLCQQDLASFLKECYNVCKYNQQHLAEVRTQVRKEFPDQFNQFIKKYINE